jgi:exosortase K
MEAFAILVRWFDKLTANGKKTNDFNFSFVRPELVEGQILTFARGSMDRKPMGAGVAALALAILIAVGLKAHYSTAAVDQLAWIMKPTAVLVQLCIGVPFEQEMGAGYINHEHRAVIAKSCAGINFMIITFCMLAFMLIRNLAWGKLSFLLLVLALAAAYASTVIVNSVRIMIALGHDSHPGGFGWLTPERIHRIEGIAVYFAALTTLAMASWVVACSCDAVSGAVGRRGRRWASGPPLGRLFFVTLGWYSIVTLGVPLLNGALREQPARFGEHALWVMGVPLFLGCLCLLFSYGWRLMRRTIFIESHTRSIKHPFDENK